MRKLLVLVTLINLTAFAFAEKSEFTGFVYVDGDRLMDEHGQVRFISYNIPCLHYNEDNLPFDETNPWRLTTEFEIADALEAVKQMGGQVVRIYTLSIARAGEDPSIPRHILGPDKFNEDAFKSLDMVLAVANRKGIRIIIPFIDNWKWWGGIEALAAFRGKKGDDFWTDSKLFEDYKKLVSFVINRTNTVTGIKYRDDKTVFAWETGNELVCPHEWTSKAAAYIKSIDKNHLVIDGYHTAVVRDGSVADENIDIVTTHHYSKNPKETIKQIKESAAKARGKKPYFIGEFGFVGTGDVRSILQVVIDEQTAGALIWSLRFRNHDGGFYWHSEPYGGDLFKAYHWPGFDSGKAYDERNLVNLMRQKAFEIRNLPLPKVPVPESPFLLDTDNAAEITWRGSAGAETYTVERSQTPEGPWLVVGSNISDAEIQYRPIFNDNTVEIGTSYYYRIKAQNESGISSSSNIIGPVVVRFKTLVDEMQDLRYIHTYDGKVTVESKQSRRFKEDMHRLTAGKENSIVYKVDASIESCKIYSFLPDKTSDLKLYLSSDGELFNVIEPEKESFFAGSGDYDYAIPVLYKVDAIGYESNYLKIVFADKAQISHVEIRYGSQSSEFKSNHSPTGFIKGFSWGWTGWRGQYNGPAPAESMMKLADTGANWVCISFGAEMEKPNEPPILWAQNNSRMVTDDEIRRSIALARKNSLKVILKPVVNVRDGTWRAWIKFETDDGEVDMQAWDKWWADFRQFLLHYARIAEQQGCEMLCLGCEMGSTERFESRWRNLIAEIRKVYGGVITYNVNHGMEHQVAWWDAVDVISISAYYPVGTDDVALALKDDLSKVPSSDTSLDAIKRRWTPIKEKLGILSEKFDRPILFIEQGVCSAKGCSAAPWTHHQPEMEYDGDEQRRYYQATIESFWDEPWFVGFTWWIWPTELYDLSEAEGHTGFSIYGKPAEKLVKKWYNKER